MKNIHIKFFFIIILLINSNIFANTEKYKNFCEEKSCSKLKVKCPANISGDAPVESILEMIDNFFQLEENYLEKLSNEKKNIFKKNLTIINNNKYPICPQDVEFFFHTELVTEIGIIPGILSSETQQIAMLNESSEENLSDEEKAELKKEEEQKEKKKKEEEAKKQKKLDEQIIIDESQVINEVYKVFIEPDVNENVKTSIFSSNTVTNLKKKFSNVFDLDKNQINQIQNIPDLKALRSSVTSLINEIESLFLIDIRKVIKADNQCSLLSETTFEYEKDASKNLQNICEIIADKSNINVVKVFLEDDYIFELFNNLDVIDFHSNLIKNFEYIDGREATIKNQIKKKKEQEEEKKKEAERQKKLAEKKKEEEAKKIAEEKKKKEEEEKKKEAERQKKLAEKKKEEEAKKIAEEKKKKEEDAKKEADKKNKKEYNEVSKLIKDLDFAEINTEIDKLTQEFRKLTFKDVFKTNFKDELDDLEKKLDRIEENKIYSEINQIVKKIEGNEILNTNQKDELSGELDTRKKDINTTDDIKEYQKDIKEIINSQDDVLQSRIADLEGQNTTYLIAIGIVILIMGGAIIYLILRRPKDDEPSQTSSIRNTSILQQEIDELKQIIRNSSQQQSNIQQTPNVTQEQPQEEVRQPTEQELFTKKLQDLGQDYFDAFSDPNKIEGFKEKWQAIGLDRESRVGASTVTTLKKDNRPFERCNFWAVPIRNSYRIFGGRILRTNSVALTADDGRMARDLLTGIFDIEYGTSFQISQQGVAVMKNQIFEITTKGKITIPKT